MVNIASLLTSGAAMLNLHHGTIIDDRASLVGTSRKFGSHLGSHACLIEVLNIKANNVSLSVWSCGNPDKLLNRDQVRLYEVVFD